MNELSKEAVSYVAVGEDGAGQRIDHYLARILKGVPKSHIYRILRSGEIRVNGGRAGPDVRLVAGDRIRVPPIRTSPNRRSGSPAVGRVVLKLRILHEDDSLLAIEKPAGLAVHGGSGVAHGLIEQLRMARPQDRFLELVHRLDRDTSGILLVAKKRASLVELHRMLREGEIDKRYLVLVRGRWRDDMRSVSVPLHRFATRDGERRVRVDDRGQASATVFRRHRAWPRHSPPLALLEAELKTGRTHQIRVHLAHIGFPIAGDDKYGDFDWNRQLSQEGLKRMFLHAHRLAFVHPIGRDSIELTSPLPADLAGYVARVEGR